MNENECTKVAIAPQECSIAEMSEESKQAWRQRRADQAELIDWILHYKNPADDETRLRQIRLVME